MTPASILGISMIQKWDIQRAAGHCAGCERKLEPGEEFYAALIDKQSCFERLDYSVEYWNEHKPEVFSFWKTTIPPANEKKNLFVDDSVLFNFFERLENEAREGEQEIWEVRLTGSKETHEVINPQLSEEEIEQVSAELGSILRGQL